MLIGVAVIIMIGLSVTVLDNVNKAGDECEGLDGKGAVRYESRSVNLPDTFGRAIAQYTFTNQAGLTSTLTITVKEVGDYAGTFTIKSDRNQDGVSVQVDTNGNVIVIAKMQGAQSITTADMIAEVNKHDWVPVTINWSDAIQLRTAGGHEVRTGAVIGFTNEIIPGEVTETIVEIFTHNEGWYKVCLDLQEQQQHNMAMLGIIVLIVAMAVILIAVRIIPDF